MKTSLQAGRREGYTYIELMISVVVLAIVTMLVIPNDKGASAQELDGAAGRLQADVAFARSWSVARPDDPVILKVDTTNNKYWLARQATPNTPITNPMTRLPYVVQFGSAGVADGKHVSVQIVDLGGDAVLAFDATGATDQATPAVVKFTVGTAAYEVAVSPAAAQVKVTDVTTRSTVPSDGRATSTSVGATSGG